MNAREATQILADQAQELGATEDDASGLVRKLVLTHGLSFYAWFCVCCELADRDARLEGYKNQGDRAAALTFGRAITSSGES